MSVASLPDFEHTLALSQGNLDAPALAECHGVACGLLVREPGCVPGAYLELLAMLQIVPGPSRAFRDALGELFHIARQQLADAEMQFGIWLPDDEESLQGRTEALAHWCNGFLAALGSGHEGGLQTLSSEAGEALEDLGEIARAEAAEDASEAEYDPEEEERAYTEIVEYIRVVVLMLREDLRGPNAGDSIH